MIAGISDGRFHPSQREWLRQMSNRVFNQFDADAIRHVKLGIKHKDVPAKRLKPNRKRATYCAARRNEALHGAVHSTWKGAETRYEPYRNPSYRIAVDKFGRRSAVPAKTYKPNGKRERERRARRQLQRMEVAA